MSDKGTTQVSETKPARPWYKKKRILIPGIIVLLIIFAAIGSSGNKSDTASTTTETVEVVEESVAPAEPAEPEVPAEYKSALSKAESYSRTMNMSKVGIYNQLTSTIEQFSPEAAQYAVDNVKADWNANALAKAKSYQQTMSMSPEAIRDQLTSSIEGFTPEEADYAVTNLNK